MALLPFVSEAAGAIWRDRHATPDAVRALRDRRLRDLVISAKERSALWRERLAHIDASLPINLAQVQPITKDEVMERFDHSIAEEAVSRAEIEAFITDPSRIGRTLKNRFVVSTTSGTTGRVGYFVSDKRAFDRMNGALLARILRYRLNPREVLRFCFGRRYRMAMAIATDGQFITRHVAAFKPLVSRALVNTQLISITDSMESVVHRLNLFRPHYLHGYPTHLEALAYERLEGRLAIDPEFISMGSEPISSRARHAIVHAFPRAQLSETYGATECLAMANQCSAGRLHVNEDLVILEPVDASGGPVPVGVKSDKIYITNLINHTQPLLRYEISDSVTLLGGDCPCGSSMRSIRVDGRADDTIFLADSGGRFHAHPPVPFEALFLGINGLRQYQLVHEAQNELRIGFVPEAGADVRSVGRSIGESFGAYLDRNQLAGAVRLVVEPAEAIQREAVGHKLRQIYSKVPRPRAL